MNLLIIGVSSYLGQAVVSRLTRRNPFRRVFGIDRRPPPLLGPTYFVGADPRDVDLGDLIITDDVQVVLNLAWSAGAADAHRDAIGLVERLLAIAAPAGLRRVVQPSRDWIYAPSETPVDTSAPRRDRATLGRSSRALVRASVGIEAAIDRWRAEGEPVEVVVPRMCTVLGPTRTRAIDEVLARNPLFGPSKGDPWLQFLHAADAAEILINAATRPDLDGPYNAAGAEPLRLSTVAGILETSVVHPPPWLARPALSALARVGATAFGPTDAVRLHLGVPMDTRRTTEAICPVRFTSRQALAVWRVGPDPRGRRGLGTTRCVDPLGAS